MSVLKLLIIPLVMDGIWSGGSEYMNITQQHGGINMVKSQIRCGPSKANITSNAVKLVIWFLAFSLRMRKLYVFIYKIGLVNENIEEFSLAIIKSPFSLQTKENIFYHYFHSVLWRYLKMQGNVMVEVIVISWFGKTHYNYSGSFLAK